MVLKEVSNNTIIDSTMKRRAKGKRVRARLKTATALAMAVEALSSANHRHAAMNGFICPPRGGVIDSLLFPALSHGGGAPICGQKHGDARIFPPSKTRLVRNHGRFLRWSGKAGKAFCSGGRNSRRLSCAEEGPNGYNEVWAPSRRDQQSESMISSQLFLGKATPDLSFLLGGGEEGSVSSDPNAAAGLSTAASVEVGQTEIEDDKGVPMEEADSMKEEGDRQEEGRRTEDMYKIRSLLLQGQIAGLRDRLKERETDVRELRMLTGGRGQSRLRELEVMLKEARSECDALKARVRALDEELAVSREEGDMLRESLLDSQKSLDDLNVYSDSLRSRYNMEMSKLEASLSEMERELTRQETAHSRERRELLDREASALADGQRFRNRSILLEREVVKIRAREADLRRENTRLLKETPTTAAEAPPSQTDQEIAALRRDNAELRLKLDDLRPADPNREESTMVDGEVESKQTSGTKVMYVGIGRRSWAKGTVEREVRSSSSGTVPGTAPGTVVDTIPGAPPATFSRTILGTVPGMVQRTVPAVEEGGVIDAVVTSGEDQTLDMSREMEGMSKEMEDMSKEMEGMLKEMEGMSKEMEGLRADNGRLTKRVKKAVEQIKVEASRADRSDSELDRVRQTVRERVQALKAALVEAEQDAQRARAEKEYFVAQWEEDIDALRRQVVDERKRRKQETRELEGIIREGEDQLDQLKARYEHLKSKMRAKSSPPVVSSDSSASKERSSERAEDPSAREQWNKALRLLEHVD